jgi:uncharacterized damage-inducible protein DinB
MPQLERYRSLSEHEKDCNQKMLMMLDLVPEVGRSDGRFQQAVTLANHLAATRENWLDFMDGKGVSQVVWWDAKCGVDALRPRFTAIELKWTEYLTRLQEGDLPSEFEFTESDEEIYRVPIQVQIEQLIGHAAYHRGQISLLVDQLGGKTVETDYVDWWWARNQ